MKYLLSSLYIQRDFLSQTNRHRVYLKAYKGSSYEINQWKVSLLNF